MTVCKHILNTERTRLWETQFWKSACLFLTQGCYFQEQPEKFLNVVHQKVFSVLVSRLFCSSLFHSAVSRYNRRSSHLFLCNLSASVPSCHWNSSHSLTGLWSPICTSGGNEVVIRYSRASFKEKYFLWL